jgi:hypothetical protein
MAIFSLRKRKILQRAGMNFSIGNNWGYATRDVEERPEWSVWKASAEKLQDLLAPAHSREPIVNKSYIKFLCHSSPRVW